MAGGVRLEFGAGDGEEVQELRDDAYSSRRLAGEARGQPGVGRMQEQQWSEWDRLGLPGVAEAGAVRVLCDAAAVLRCSG
jgi:hypothetical protein